MHSALSRMLLTALLGLILSSCISGIDYGDVPHEVRAAGPRCNPAAVDDGAISDKPIFLVTSRLPDCTGDAPALTDFRSSQLRYGHFSRLAGESKAAKQKTLLAFAPQHAWWAALETKAKANEGRVLVFVHGYRETFNTSSRDAAQIARLTQFSGPVIHYSWPSHGELLSYGVDEANMHWDERNFRMFLESLAEKPWLKDITVVAHSLGTRLVIPAIEYVDRNIAREDAGNISRIILASPDTDTSAFERDIGKTILSPNRVASGRRLTIYVSAKDRALGVSRTLHGYPRLGSPYCFNPFEVEELKAKGLPARCYPTKTKGVETMEESGLTIIDTTGVSVGRSGHSNYLRSASACLDFVGTVNKGQGDSRIATHLRHVFKLKPYAKGEEPDHRAICKRGGKRNKK
ncbi:MAG: alpha/beta hydrolase [Sphingorhabdus sp.]